MVGDVELLQRWRGGDLVSGQELVARHFGVVHRFFRSKVEAAADDLTQRTFVACLEAGDRLEQVQSFRAYALGIARNVLFDHHRATRRAARLEDFATISADQLSVSQVVANREEQRLLLLALRSIPIDLQTTLELYYWEELTQLEIGTVLSIPEGTVKSRLNRARALLRERITKMAGSAAVLESTLGGFERWTRSLRAVFGDGAPPAPTE